MGKLTRRAWYNKPAWCNSAQIKGSSIGIELEVEATNNRHYRTILSLMPDFSSGRSPIAVPDGSISNYSGVELIFPPTRPSMLLKANAVFRRTIEAIAGDVTEGNTDTGMHFNVNTKDWSNAAINTFLVVVNKFERNKLERLGGRRLTSYCSQYRFNYMPTLSSIQLGDIRGAHSYAAEWKGNRIECRFPIATTNQERIGYIIDFCTLLEKFSREYTPDGSTPTNGVAPLFMKFLGRCKKGKELLKYMSPPQKEAAPNDSTTVNPPAEQAVSVSSASPAGFAGVTWTYLSSESDFLDPRAIFQGP